MARKRDCKFFGYVKVERQAAAPRRWLWSVRMDAGDHVVLCSDAPYPSAEDAWQAGRRALDSLEKGNLARGHAALEEID